MAAAALAVALCSLAAAAWAESGFSTEQMPSFIKSEPPPDGQDGQAAGLDAALYTHPIGVHGHAAGPIIGLWDHQEGVPGRGDYPLHANTCHALELNVKAPVPEWDGQWVQIKLEQSALFDGEKVHYLAGRQTAWHVVR